MLLGEFAKIIYESAIEEFGGGEGKKKLPTKTGGLSRRQRVLAELRKQKRDLKKQRESAPPEEKEGLKALFEDLKKKKGKAHKTHVCVPSVVTVALI